jgi:lysophospholipase L1-like esterase
MVIGDGSKLVFIGDSITDCGRAQPVGEANFATVGNGYVSLVAAHLGAACPEKRIRVVNVGTSGNTVRDLAARWKTDVLDLAPQWLSIMIGINDVWRQYDSPLLPELAVPLAEYRRVLDDLVKRTKPTLKGLVLMTPYLIEPNAAEPMRKTMDEYGAAVKECASRYGAVLVDTQAAFAKVLASVHPMSLAWDRVHPNLAGHLVIARAFLAAVGAL